MTRTDSTLGITILVHVETFDGSRDLCAAALANVVILAAIAIDAVAELSQYALWTVA
jgi:hypothetical protein